MSVRISQVERIVQCASDNKFVIIPFGGGTSVSGAVTCPANEPRPIVVLDTTNMNSILWLDKEQLLARIQVSYITTLISNPFVDPEMFSAILMTRPCRRGRTTMS